MKSFCLRFSSPAAAAAAVSTFSGTLFDRWILQITFEYFDNFGARLQFSRVFVGVVWGNEFPSATEGLDRCPRWRGESRVKLHLLQVLAQGAPLGSVKKIQTATTRNSRFLLLNFAVCLKFCGRKKSKLGNAMLG